MALAFHALFLACSVIGLVVALYGVSLVVRKRVHPHQPISSSLKLPAGIELTTEDHAGLVIITGLALLALGAVLWTQVPWDVVAPPGAPPARPSGPATPVAPAPAPTTPSAQSQQLSAPEDAADSARKVGIWKSITDQINALSRPLDNVASEANKWKVDSNDSTAQSISGVLQVASGKFYNMRVSLELLSRSYPQYPEIGEALEQVRRSPGAAPIPGNLFDRLQRSLGVDPSVSKDIAMPYIEAMLGNIKDFKEWQRATLQKAPR